jgi:hypothetical protein
MSKYKKFLSFFSSASKQHDVLEQDTIHVRELMQSRRGLARTTGMDPFNLDGTLSIARTHCKPDLVVTEMRNAMMIAPIPLDEGLLLLPPNPVPGLDEYAPIAHTATPCQARAKCNGKPVDCWGRHAQNCPAGYHARTARRHDPINRKLAEAARVAGMQEVRTEVRDHTLLLDKYSPELCCTLFPKYLTLDQHKLVMKMTTLHLTNTPRTSTEESARIDAAILPIEQEFKSSLGPSQKQQNQGLRMDLVLNDSRTQQHWYDACVVGYSSDSTTTRDIKQAVKDIETVIKDPTIKLQPTSRAMEAAGNRKTKHYSLLHMLAVDQGSRGLRRDNPVFEPLVFSAGAVFGQGPLDLVQTLSSSFFQKFRRVHGARDDWGWSAQRRTSEFRNRLMAHLAQIVTHGNAAMILRAGAPWSKGGGRDVSTPPPR